MACRTLIPKLGIEPSKIARILTTGPPGIPHPSLKKALTLGEKRCPQRHLVGQNYVERPPMAMRNT